MSNPGAAGKFYTADYVLVPADQLILRANIFAAALNSSFTQGQGGDNSNSEEKQTAAISKKLETY